MFHNPSQAITEEAAAALFAPGTVLNRGEGVPVKGGGPALRVVADSVEAMADAVEAADPEGEHTQLYDEALKALHALRKVAFMLEAGDPFDAHRAHLKVLDTA